MHLSLASQAAVVLGVIATLLVASLFPRSVTEVTQPPGLRASLLSLPGLAAPPASAATVAPQENAPVALAVLAQDVTGDDGLRAGELADAAASALEEAILVDSANDEDAEATDEEPETPLPIFFRYEVQEGDTLSSVAANFGIEAQYLVWNNAELIPNEDLLTVGQVLQVPSVAGIIHSVRVDETVSEIAALYEADAGEIVDFAPNALASDPNLLREGSTILVPGGRVLPPAAPAIRPSPPVVAASDSDEDTPASITAPASNFGFIWPRVDSITSYYGPTHPLGIDIDAEVGSPIFAAAAGQVVFAGGDPCCSYGLYVEIEHEGGTYTTLYAHMGTIAVELGQFVEQGQLLGTIGLTGRTTGAHIHFEIRRDGIHQDPLLYLP
jgi:murein DD-endopeptidase MepM/ murein hydrolase activator NlpD